MSDTSPAAPALPTLSLASALRGLRREGLRADLLESALDVDGLGACSYLLADPLVLAAAEADEPLRLLAGPAALARALPADPLDAVDALLEATRPPDGRADPHLGFAGGAVLALAYDLGRRYERIGSRARRDVPVPDVHAAIYSGGLAVPRGRTPRIVGRPSARAREAFARLLAGGACPPPPFPPGTPPVLRASSLDAEAYRDAVRSAQAAIRRGEVFEVNLSRRIDLDGVDPDALYERLVALAPAPYMADLDLGDGRRLLSASPERFLALSPDGRAESWPIKGTRRRGRSPAEDRALASELLGSEKDAAELAMIVDLVRNDLGRVAAPGSVRVRNPRRLQSWPTVHHTVAVVEARLAPGRRWTDLVRAAFPPGSVTGAPKIRAMELIDRLEPVRRGLYCGAFGTVGWDGAVELAVAIRVVVCAGGSAQVHSGGAVLLDSDPEAEEREACDKARALLAAARGGARDA